MTERALCPVRLLDIERGVELSEWVVDKDDMGMGLLLPPHTTAENEDL